MTGAGADTGRCRRPGCTSPAFRARDELSYATDHYVWICLSGHKVPEERPAARDRTVA